MNQVNTEVLGLATDSFSESSGSSAPSFNEEGKPNKAVRYGMTQEEYRGYLAHREETRMLCDAYLAFYSTNPLYHIAL